MYQDVIYIVGDSFSNFSKIKGVMSFSELMGLINKPETTGLRQSVFVVGQGINQNEKIQLELLSHQNKIGAIMNAYQRHAGNQITHKHKQENILITEPLVVHPDKEYCAYLAADDACADMSDHLTGYHIQGMVLTEAARQMMLAIAEKYVVNADERYHTYCVLTSLNSCFLKFAFPINLIIKHEILSKEVFRANSYEVNSRTRFIQNDEVVAQVDIEYKLYNKFFLERLEKKLAIESVASNGKEMLEQVYLDMAS